MAKTNNPLEEVLNAGKSFRTISQIEKEMKDPTSQELDNHLYSYLVTKLPEDGDETTVLLSVNPQDGTGLLQQYPAKLKKVVRENIAADAANLATLVDSNLDAVIGDLDDQHLQGIAMAFPSGDKNYAAVEETLALISQGYIDQAKEFYMDKFGYSFFRPSLEGIPDALFLDTVQKHSKVKKVKFMIEKLSDKTDKGYVFSAAKARAYVSNAIGGLKEQQKANALVRLGKLYTTSKDPKEKPED